MAVVTDIFKKVRTGFKWAAGFKFEEPKVVTSKGLVMFEMRDARTGELQLQREEHNVVTLDAGLLVARLMKDNEEPDHGINMLGVGTG
ncbi:MAG: hypothetical protein E4G90_05625, partial [Gemmatimonadales bacterium]